MRSHPKRIKISSEKDQSVLPGELVKNQTALIFCSSGGHLVEAHEIAKVLDFSSDSTIITYKRFDSERSDSIYRTLTVPYVKSRSILDHRHSFKIGYDFLRNNKIDIIVSTGAGIAISGAMLALIFRKKFLFFESMARIQTVSRTGNFLEKLGLATIVVQHSSLKNGNRFFLESPFGNFGRISRDTNLSGGKFKIFVAAGTIYPYRFDRLVSMVNQIIVPGDRVVWQLGTSISENSCLFGEVHEIMKPDFFQLCLRDADVIICHSGIATILDCLRCGKVPIVVPRDAAREEHVDNHQFEISDFLASMELIIDGRDGFAREILSRAIGFEVVSKNLL
jgi:UDP-N-acetylglucosamine transferase subunit ALG13